MPAFPRHSIAWQLERPHLLRRFTLSITWFGIATGVASRVYRWAILSTIAPTRLGLTLIAIGIGVGGMCALAATHLASYTLRTWRWRAPVLGASIALGESITSLLLTFVHEERLGRSVATLAEWPSTVASVLLSRVAIVSLFALVLSAVVVALRKSLEPEASQKAG